MAQESIRKQLPIGVSDYQKLISGNYYYVDKSLLIPHVWRAGEVVLMPRPRRFGKTLNLSMLRYFFEKADTDFELLFESSKLLQDHPEYREFMGKYPVIFLTFKDVGEDTWEDTYENFKSIIGKEFERHLTVYEALTSARSKKMFQKILQGEASRTDLTSSLQFLSNILHDHYQQKVIIILDEYDAPLHAGYNNNYYKKAVGFSRALLSKALKDNVYIEKSFISGILTIAKEGMFSGLNNVDIMDITQDRAVEYFGFTESEVGELLNYYDLSEHTSMIREWYDGYHFGDQHNMYNPWSVLKCIQCKGDFETYWVHTGQDSLIKKLLGKARQEVKSNLELLLTGQELDVLLEKSIVMTDLEKGVHLLWSLLLFAGYLTYSHVTMTDDGKSYSLKIPNKELKLLYNKLITQIFSEAMDPQLVRDFMHALIQGNVGILTPIMQDFIISSISAFDIPQKETEKSYHLFVLGLLVILRDQYGIKSNRESGYGRYDIMLIPKQNNLIPIIIEFKKSSSHKALETSADAGLEQIKEKKYAQEIKERGFTQYRAYGMAFFGKEVFIKMEHHLLT